MKMMMKAQFGIKMQEKEIQIECLQDKPGELFKPACPRDVIISSDIGNNCAIGNAYPTFEKGRKYLAPGLFGPCGYGFPSILGAKIGCPDTPVIGFAGDGAFGISMNEMSSCAREEWPAITMVIFRNYQWGAEKRNTTLWFDDNFVGTELRSRIKLR
jgi:sulfoacetaldehyde acetyltransferase